MSKRNIIRCHYFEGMNFSWNLNIFSGPKFYIECGECFCGFKQRIPVRDYPKVWCPYCGTVNEIPIEFG